MAESEDREAGSRVVSGEAVGRLVGLYAVLAPARKAIWWTYGVMTVLLLALQRDNAPFTTVLAAKKQSGFLGSGTDFRKPEERIEWLIDTAPSVDLMIVIASMLATQWVMTAGLEYRGAIRIVRITGRVLATVIFGAFLGVCATLSALALITASLAQNVALTSRVGGLDWEPGPFVFFAIVGAPGVVGMVYVARRLYRVGTRGLLHRITTVATIASMSTLGVTGTASLLTAPTNDIGITDLAFGFAFVPGLWTLGLLAYLSRYRVVEPPAVPTDAGAQDIGAYLRSARQVSLVLLLLVAVQTQILGGLKDAAAPLIGAREIYAHHVFAETLAAVRARLDVPVLSRTSRIDQAVAALRQGGDEPVVLRVIDRNLRMGDRDIRIEWKREGAWKIDATLRVDLVTGLQWAVEKEWKEGGDVTEVLEDRIAALRRNGNIDDLVLAGRRLGTDGEVGDQASFDDALYQIESDFARAEVTVPVLGFALAPGPASRVVLALVLGALVVLRNRITATIEMGGPFRGEPWLVLDGRQGLAKAGSLLWIASIAIAPLVALACSFDVTETTGRITGGASIASLVVGTVFYVVIWPVVAWVSLAACADVLQLRRHRMAAGAVGPPAVR